MNASPMLSRQGVFLLAQGLLWSLGPSHCRRSIIAIR
jgi:hypothetical protein